METEESAINWKLPLWTKLVTFYENLWVKLYVLKCIYSILGKPRSECDSQLLENARHFGDCFYQIKKLKKSCKIKYCKAVSFVVENITLSNREYYGVKPIW